MPLLENAIDIRYNQVQASAAYLNGIRVWSPTASGIVQTSLFMELDATDYTTGLWTDRTGNNNNATINGATWSSNNNGIFNFNGINNTISIPHVPALSLSTTTQKTLQVWINFAAVPTATNRMIAFSKLSSAYSFDGYFGGFYIDSTAVIATNGTGIAKTTYSTQILSINTWYLFTFISQITNTANSTKVYINETEYISTAHGTDGYSESNNLTLGYMPAPTAGLGLIQYLNGKIGACYFYTKGLTPAEISQNYNATKQKYGV